MKKRIREGRTRKDRCYTRVWSQGKWKLKQRVMWEKKYGPIPEGYVICFLDGNPRNLKMKNLACVPRGTLLEINKTMSGKRNPEMTRSQILVCELEREIKGVMK